MTRIPTSALLLGLAGLIPFLWGASTSATLLVPYLPWQPLGPILTGPTLLVTYGTVILSFMAGVIWGFAARDETRWMAVGLVLSVLPALWIFFFTGQDQDKQLLALIAGFTGLLAIDYLCARRGLAPPWWMPLRILLTSVVLFCLVMGYLLLP